MAPNEMGKTMGLLGVAGLVSSIVVTALSDKLGRKKVVFFFLIVGALYHFVVYFLAGTALHLSAMFLTYFLMGAIPLVAAVIPSEEC